MDKRYQVFVSSTYTDLIDERKEATQAILRCDCFPAGMELFPASSREKWRTIKRVIDDSDFYLLILAGRYGSLGVDDRGMKVGYTEMEFNYALSTKKPIIALLHSNPDMLPGIYIERTKTNRDRLTAFRNVVLGGRMVAYWENKDQLHSAVLDSLNKLKRDTPEAIGWIRTNDIEDLKSNNPLKFEWYFTADNTGRRVWKREGAHLWIETAAGIAEPKCFASIKEERLNQTSGTVVQSLSQFDEFGFQIFIPNLGEKDMRLFWRVVHKLHNSWQPLGVSEITYIL